MKRWLIGVALFAPSALHAEPAHYVAAGMSFGASEPIYDGYTVLGAIDGGYRLSQLWWAHAAVAYGPSVDRFGQHAPNGGHDLVVRGGTEVRWCAAILCGFAGGDLGIQRGSFTDSVYMQGTRTFTDTAAIVTPRAGFDAGSERLRVRVEIDADLAVAVTQDNPMYETPGFGKVIGVALAAGVAYQW